MKTCLLIASKESKGGVSTLIEKIANGLTMEGVKVVKYFIGKPMVEFHLTDLLRSLKMIECYDALLYFGSTAGLGCFVDKIRGIPSIIFISGHQLYENFMVMHDKKRPLRDRVGALLNIAYNKSLLFSDKVDLWVCHTLTAAEEIGLSSKGDKLVILKQFMLPDEIKYYRKFAAKANMKNMNILSSLRQNVIQIFSYLSYARLPGFKLNDLIRIFKYLERHVKRKVHLIIEHPLLKSPKRITSSITIVGRMPREDFLTVLSNSDLYIETTIDEELRLTSLDAALLSVPIAKFIDPRFLGRQDYTDNEILFATSLRDFLESLIEYVNNLDHYKAIYSKNVFDFIIKKRNWEAVKEPFLSKLNALIMRNKVGEAI